jgi:hypothetical protein
MTNDVTVESIPLDDLYARYTRNEQAIRAVHDVVTLMNDKTPGKLYTVVKTNPTTLILAPADGGLQVKASRCLVEDAPAGSAAKIADSYAAALPHQPVGALVRVKYQTAAGINPGEVAVVIVDKGDIVHVAKIGGVSTPKGDAYARLPRRLLEAVKPADVLVPAEVKPVATARPSRRRRS